MGSQDADRANSYENLLEVVVKRRSVRRFEKGKKVDHETLLKIAEAGRWAPTGANAQCWDLIVLEDADTRQAVLDVFLRQSQRLVDYAKGFPAVKKTYLANTVAIFVVLGDPRFKSCFPQATSPEWQREYSENNERIFLCFARGRDPEYSACRHRLRSDVRLAVGRWRGPNERRTCGRPGISAIPQRGRDHTDRLSGKGR